jgi:E3 ubiquitin-protein ligase BRE1
MYVESEVKIKVEKTEDSEENGPSVKDEMTDEKPQLLSPKKEDCKDHSSPLVLSKAVIEENSRLLNENKRLQDLVTQLQQKHHEISIMVCYSFLRHLGALLHLICIIFQNSELSDNLGAAETEVAELKNKVEDVEYQLSSERHLVEKLDRHLSEALLKLKSCQEGEIQVQGGGEGVSKNQVMKCHFNYVSCLIKFPFPVQ